MKIAVVGCGALGSYYGAKLAQGEPEVHFLLRSDYDHVKRDGVSIRSVDGDFHVRPYAARLPEEIGVSDLIVIGLKTTANGTFERLLGPLVGERTAILTLQNGLGNEEALAGLFGPEKVMGGLCFVCLNRVGPGTIHHIAHGQIVMGEHGRPAQERTHAIASLFERSGVRCRVTDDLERSHWQKLVWNIPFNGLGVGGAAGYDAVRRGRLSDEGERLGPCFTTDILLGSSQWHSMVRELMEEVIATAWACGKDLPGEIADKQIARTAEMGAYKASTLVDFERGNPLELESIFLRPLRIAEAHGVEVPRLRGLCALLQELDALPVEIKQGLAGRTSV